MVFLEEKRPSRMLNLNKSPRDQKIIAAYNAENSPFLLLSPELRSRIYDFVFGDLVIRRQPWKNSVCQKHQACEVKRRERYDQKISYYLTPDQIHPSDLKEDLGLISCRTQKQARIPVRLLQVCRQIYHEAALKPFSEPTFDIANCGLSDRPGCFASRMVPAQIKAIAHLRVVDNQYFRIAETFASNLSGLEHFEIGFVIRMTDSWYLNPLEEMQTFETKGGVEWLKGIGLKSVLFTTFIVGDTSTVDDEGLDAPEASIRKWSERKEAEILGH
ncbi:hypothetical protein Q7P36_009638 [Cladosporium allicinum]